MVIHALPQPLRRTIAKRLFGGMLQHDLHKLLPLMEASGLSDIEIGPVLLRILGLSVLGFVRGNTQKS